MNGVPEGLLREVEFRVNTQGAGALTELSDAIQDVEHEMAKLAAAMPLSGRGARQQAADIMYLNGELGRLQATYRAVDNAISGAGNVSVAALKRQQASARAILERLVATHSAPEFIRSDHGPEFIALAIRGWLAQHQTRTLYIDPGCPWQNGYGESFNGTVRDECLNMHVFHAVAEARVMLAAYLRHYNEERPHSSLGYRTPVEFKRDWLERRLPLGGP